MILFFAAAIAFVVGTWLGWMLAIWVISCGVTAAAIAFVVGIWLGWMLAIWVISRGVTAELMDEHWS